MTNVDSTAAANDKQRILIITIWLYGEADDVGGVERQRNGRPRQQEKCI